MWPSKYKRTHTSCLWQILSHKQKKTTELDGDWTLRNYAFVLQNWKQREKMLIAVFVCLSFGQNWYRLSSNSSLYKVIFLLHLTSLNSKIKVTIKHHLEILRSYLGDIRCLNTTVNMFFKYLCKYMFKITKMQWKWFYQSRMDSSATVSQSKSNELGIYWQMSIWPSIYNRLCTSCLW